MDLAVILVSWNVRDILLDALHTLYADLESSSLSAQVIVIDNASADDTVSAVREHFPQVDLIAHDANLGFAGGNNYALRYLGFGDATTPADALPRAVYLLNCDTLTQSGATQTLFDTLMADAYTGVVGARLTYGDGSFQHAGFAFPDLRQLWVEFFPTPGRLIDSRFNGRYPQAHYAASAPFAVDFMLGATMMLKREVIQQTGMFDTRFFMYCEEIDWQWRIRAAGWRILCVPAAHVVHLGGQSTGQVKARSVIDLWRSRLHLFDKHYPAWKRALARQMMIWGMRRKIAHTERSDLIEAYTTVIEMAQT